MVMGVLASKKHIKERIKAWFGGKNKKSRNEAKLGFDARC
jgi:hypothetical protein